MVIRKNIKYSKQIDVVIPAQAGVQREAEPLDSRFRGNDKFVSHCAGMTKKKTGSLSIEMLAAVGIMAALISVLAGVGGTFKKVNDQRWVRHTLLAAGQAQMDAIATTGKPIDKETFTRLWPNVACTVEMTDGEAEWEGLEKIQLYLSAKYRQRTLKTSLIRYVPAEKGSQK